MKENYWNQFMASGRIDDYLKFKMYEKSSGAVSETKQCGKEQRESDRTYGDGALNHAHRGI